jgi:hypothetical protein
MLCIEYYGLAQSNPALVKILKCGDEPIGRKDRLKGQCHEIFASGFFLEPVSPKSLIIPLGPFRNFSKILGDIRSSRFATGQRHRWQMEKTFKQKNFNNFVWTPFGSRVNIYKNFCLQDQFKVSAA